MPDPIRAAAAGSAIRWAQAHPAGRHKPPPLGQAPGASILRVPGHVRRVSADAAPTGTVSPARRVSVADQRGQPRETIIEIAPAEAPAPAGRSVQAGADGSFWSPRRQLAAAACVIVTLVTAVVALLATSENRA
jgi:hypothetical protein